MSPYQHIKNRFLNALKFLGTALTYYNKNYIRYSAKFQEYIYQYNEHLLQRNDKRPVSKAFENDGYQRGIYHVLKQGDGSSAFYT